MKKLTSIIAGCLCLIMVLSLIGCGGGGNIKGSWKTRPQMDENQEVLFFTKYHPSKKSVASITQKPTSRA